MITITIVVIAIVAITIVAPWQRLTRVDAAWFRVGVWTGGPAAGGPNQTPKSFFELANFLDFRILNVVEFFCFFCFYFAIWDRLARPGRSPARARRTPARAGRTPARCTFGSSESASVEH